MPATPLWAQSWAKYGDAVPADQAQLGDVLVFKRDGGGHVGLYIAEDTFAYHVLGGNQGDAVSIVRLMKVRCIAVRRPPFKTALPPSARRYVIGPNGTRTSTNEA
jgi:cell wall-associated NlpC family hydrolase